MAGFDWYQATIPAPLDDVLEVLSGMSGTARIKHRRGCHGYASNTLVEDASGQLAQVWWGGTHCDPHIVLSGDPTQSGVEVIRAHFPKHFVTRADAREDFDGADTFDRLVPQLLDVATRHRVNIDTKGDHYLKTNGRTLYLGSKKSAVQLRMYDKAAELRRKFHSDPARLAELPEHLTRVEAQVRPQHTLARQAFATIEPLAVMGSSPWLREVWKRVADADLQPVQVGKPWRQADDDRAYAYLLAQYGGLLKRMHADIGSWDLLGRQIGDDLAERDRARRG